MNDTREPFWLRGRGMALILFAAVAVTHFWMTGLEFQLDDFEQIHDASDWSKPAVLLGQDSGEQVAERNRPSFVKFFRPVLHLSFAADAALFGARPFAFHLSSLAYHYLACVLLFFVFRQFLPLDVSSRLPALSAIVFAVHPGKWGAVSWVAARGDVLLAIFFLLSVQCLIRFRERGRALDLAFCFLALLAAMGSKESGMSCPLILVLLDVFWLRGRGGGVTLRRSMLIGVPLVVMTASYLGFRQ